MRKSFVCKLIKNLFKKVNLKGFTLVELIIVIIIIGILSIVAVPIYQYRVEKAKLTEAYTMLKAIADANVAYYLEHGKYTSDISLLDIELESNAKLVASVNRIETENFIYSAGSSGSDNLLAFAQRKPLSKRYYIYITQAKHPSTKKYQLGLYKIAAYSYDGKCSMIDKQVVAEINKKKGF